MMNEPIQYHSETDLEMFLERGVVIPDPSTVRIERCLQPGSIAPGVVLHPYCRIEGERSRLGADALLGISGPVRVCSSVVGRGSKVGTLGPVVLRDTVLGPFTVLGSGTAEDTVFLGKENEVNDFTAGYGFRTRRGTLYEEDSSSAQHTDTKMTLLFPWATLGSNINFCDALVSGGSGPELGSFSEIGSGTIHYNFTPSGDKATSSLFGNAVEGVFLNRERIFIGGNNSLLGPMDVQFGASSAAGIRIHGKLTSGLHTGQVLTRRTIKRDFRILIQVRRTIASQFNYLGELCALQNWYREIRVGVMADEPETRELYSEGMRMVRLNIEERIEQLRQFFKLLDQSVDLLSVNQPGGKELERQRFIAACWPKLEEDLKGTLELEIPCPLILKNELDGSDAGFSDYTRRIREISPEAVQKGAEWLMECREKGGRSLIRLLDAG